MGDPFVFYFSLSFWDVRIESNEEVCTRSWSCFMPRRIQTVQIKHKPARLRHFSPDNVRLSLLASCELSPINIYHFGDDLRSRTEPGASRVLKLSKYLTNTNIRRLLFVEKKPHSQKRVFEKSKMKLFTVLPLAALGQFGDPAQMAQMVLPMIKQFYNSEFFFIPESISK